jgi:azurin
MARYGLLRKKRGCRKTRFVFLIALVCAVLGCSRSTSSKLVEITGNDDMKFDVTGFQVKPGQTVTVTMTNIGRLPKAAMAHDWVLLKKGTDAAKFAEAGERHPESDYIAPDQSDQVLVRTRLLGPGESDSVTFTAPNEPGSYEYVCTFPEHYPRGMKGVMTVIPK